MRLGESYAASGNRDEVLRILEELKKPAQGSYSPPYNIAVVYARLGDREKAYEWLERAIERRSSSCLLLGIDPAFDSFRNDARFQELLQKTHLPSSSAAPSH
jgi:adenylate cyclase